MDPHQQCSQPPDDKGQRPDSIQPRTSEGQRIEKPPATEPVEAPSCTSPTHVEVQREWTNPRADTQSDLSVVPQITVGKGSGSGPFALQRWQNECMREQPYHIIGAVPRDGPSQG